MVANATTDNTSAIQKAIEAAASAGGGIVALPAGTFLIDGHLVARAVERAGAPETVVLVTACHHPGLSSSLRGSTMGAGC